MRSAARVALKMSLGESINVSRENGLTVSATRHVRSKSESDGSSDTFVSKLPPAVTNVPREDIRAYLHSKRVNNYLVGNTLGEGSFAKVKEALHQLVGEKVALKVIDKKKAQQDPYVAKNFRREARLLQMVHHPNILRLYEVIETDNSYYLITELCSGGELMKYIYKKGHLDETETRKFMRQIISAIDHLHKAGIIHRSCHYNIPIVLPGNHEPLAAFSHNDYRLHPSSEITVDTVRDLKVENLLLDSNLDIRLIDFGLSNEEYTEGEGGRIHCSTQCGSPAYAAPELLGHKQYGPEVDIWSIGVNMYAMLTGCLPYTVEPFNITALHAKMLENKMNPIPDHLSDSCKDLLGQLLTSNPEKRIKMPEVMAHPWLNEGHSLPFSPAPFPNRLTSNDINKDIMEHMIHMLPLKETEDDITQELVANRSTSASAIYHLLAARLARYQKQLPKRVRRRSISKRLSQDQGYFEGEEDEAMSIASCPTGRGRANTLPRKQVPLRNGTQARKPRPISDPKDGSLPQPIVPNRLHRRRKTVPPTILEQQLTEFHLQREEGTFPQRPQTQLKPVRPPAFLTRNSHSQPHALNQLRQDLTNYIPPLALPPARVPAWHSQPNSRVGSRNPSRAGSRNPSVVNSRNTSNSSIGAHSQHSPPELADVEDSEELQFHHVNSYTPKPKHRQVSTTEGMFFLDPPSDAQDTHLPAIPATTSRTTRHSSESSSSHKSAHRNGYLSSSGDIQIRTDLNTEGILTEIHRVASNLKMRECVVSQNAQNTVTCFWRGIQFQITIHKESRHGTCRLNFHWLLGGNHASYVDICETVIQKITL